MYNSKLVLSQTLSTFDKIIQHNMTSASVIGGNFPFNVILATVSLVGMFSKHFSKLTFRVLEVEFSKKTQVPS